MSDHSPSHERDRFIERLQGAASPEEIERIIPDIEGALAANYDTDLHMLLIPLYINLFRKDKAQAALADVLSRFPAHTPLPVDLILYQAEVESMNGRTGNALDIIGQIEDDRLDHNSKLLVTGLKILYTSTLHRLSEMMEYINDFSVLSLPDEPLDLMGELLFISLAEVISGDKAAKVIDDALSFVKGQELLEQDNYRNIYEFIIDTLADDRQCIDVYPLVRSQWDYPIEHSGFAIVYGELSEEEALDREVSVGAMVGEKFPGDSVMIWLMTQNQVLS